VTAQRLPISAHMTILLLVEHHDMKLDNLPSRLGMVQFMLRPFSCRTVLTLLCLNIQVLKT
jgi:hypothetical protein